MPPPHGLPCNPHCGNGYCLSHCYCRNQVPPPPHLQTWKPPPYSQPSGQYPTPDPPNYPPSYPPNYPPSYSPAYPPIYPPNYPPNYPPHYPPNYPHRQPSEEPPPPHYPPRLDRLAR